MTVSQAHVFCGGRPQAEKKRGLAKNHHGKENDYIPPGGGQQAGCE